MDELKKPKIPPKNPSNLNFSSSKPNLDKPMTNDTRLIHKNNVVESKRVPEKTVKGKNYKIIYITLAVILLAILIAVSTTMIVVYPTAKRMSDIKIDFSATSKFEPISIDTEASGPQREYAMPGDQINCQFKISSKKDPNFTEDVNLDVFLRFKVSVNLDQNYISSMDENEMSSISLEFVDTNWMKGVDGYYYLTKSSTSKGVLSPGDTIEISRSFILSTAIGNEYAGKKVGITFEAEALQANYQAIVELWPTAPYQWSSQYRDLI